MHSGEMTRVNWVLKQMGRLRHLQNRLLNSWLYQSSTQIVVEGKPFQEIKGVIPHREELLQG